jgi:predicted AAA+ superfamily ATPase
MLDLYAATTAQIVPKDSPLADRFGIDRRTVASYRDLLLGLHVIWTLPPLVPGNAVGQVTRSPKLHLVDSGLAAYLAGRDSDEALARDPQFTGQLVETMVANDIRVQCTAHPTGLRLRHFREDRHEVDLVIEAQSGAIWGVEVKLAASPGDRDLSGLRRLARSVGDRFRGGVILCRTPVGHQVEDGIAIAPIEALWTGAAAGRAARPVSPGRGAARRPGPHGRPAGPRTPHRHPPARPGGDEFLDRPRRG